MKRLIRVNTNIQTVPPVFFPVGTAEVLRLCLFARRCARMSAHGALNLEQQA